LLFHTTKLLDHDSVLITIFLVFNISRCFIHNVLHVGTLIIYYHVIFLMPILYYHTTENSCRCSVAFIFILFYSIPFIFFYSIILCSILSSFISLFLHSTIKLPLEKLPVFHTSASQNISCDKRTLEYKEDYSKKLHCMCKKLKAFQSLVLL
jgi:hypothetical protein